MSTTRDDYAGLTDGDFLDKIPVHDQKQDEEENFLQIGGRGHFENPTTQLLGFFLDTCRSHGFKTGLLNVFLKAIGKDNLDTSIAYKVDTEVTTQEGLRLDLVLRSDQWILVVENKIRHWAANDFDTYAAYARSQCSGEVVLVLLSIAEVSAMGDWIGLRWQTLIDAFRNEIGPSLLGTGIPSKWPIFLREYLNNIENEWKRVPAMDTELVKFANDNYAKLVKAQKLRIEFLQALLDRWKQQLEEMYSLKLVRTAIRGEWRFKEGNLTPLYLKIEDPTVEIYLKVWDAATYGVNIEIPESLLPKINEDAAFNMEFRKNNPKNGRIHLVGDDKHPNHEEVFNVLVRVIETLLQTRQ